MDRNLKVEIVDNQIIIQDVTNIVIGIVLNVKEARNIRNQIDACLKQIEISESEN